jgi:hypothetical protein
MGSVDAQTLTGFLCLKSRFLQYVLSLILFFEVLDSQLSGLQKQAKRKSMSRSYHRLPLTLLPTIWKLNHIISKKSSSNSSSKKSIGSRSNTPMSAGDSIGHYVHRTGIWIRSRTKETFEKVGKVTVLKCGFPNTCTYW